MAKNPEKIPNPKAWLSQIIHSFCMDIHRQRQRVRMENIDNIKFADYKALISSLESPESKMLSCELTVYLRYKIESLPPRLRYPFILHYCQKKSYRSIAKQLFLTEESVRKRVQKAQSILQQHFNKYFAGEDEISLNFSLFQNMNSQNISRPPSSQKKSLERVYATFLSKY